MSSKLQYNIIYNNILYYTCNIDRIEDELIINNNNQ